MRPTVVALLALTAVLAPVATAATAEVDAGCDSEVRVDGPFRTVAKPPLLTGPVTAHAVEPQDPRTVHLADPERVVTSTDAGCTWQLVLELPALPNTAIRSLVVPDTGAVTGRLLVAVGTEQVRNGSFASSTVVMSRTGPDEPFRRSAPLPGTVTPVVAPGEPDVVYAASSDVTLFAVAPARSTDGGATFLPVPGSPRTYPLPSGPSVDGGARTVAVDPASRDGLLVGSGSLQRSRDGGTTWSTALGQPEVQYAHALAAHPAGGGAEGRTVLAATSQSNTGLQDDSARLWSVPRDGAPEALPTGPPLIGVPESLAVGRDADEVVLVTASLPTGLSDGYDGPGAVYLLDAPRRTWVDVADGRGHPLLGAQVDRTGDPAVHLHTSTLSDPPGVDAYVVYDPPAEGRVVPPTVDAGEGAPELPPAPRACPDAPLFSPPQRRTSASRLEPATVTVDAGPDGRAAQRVDLALAGDTSALDLQVLLDVSDSMGPAAAGIVCGLEELLTGLAAEGVDLRVGLSTFYDSGPGQRYVREVDLGPPGPELQLALRSVRTRGGEETHRTALLQTATGRGLQVDGVEHVPPGQGASFRPDALRVVLHVTDEPWTATTAGEPSPLEVTAALRDAGVRHVGLQVLQDPAATGAGGDRVSGAASQPLLRAQLDQFSAGTGALAPDGGVDCDGDGRSDLRAGDPLVCVGVVDGGAVPVAAPVRALLSAVQARGPVALEAASEVAAAEVGARYDDVDLRTAGRFAFPVSLACRQATGDVPIRLTARAAGVPVATGELLLRCPPAAVAPPAAAAGAAEAVPVPGDPAPGPVGLVLPPLPAPPVTVQAPAPGTAVQSAAQSAGQTAAQTAAQPGAAAAAAPRDERSGRVALAGGEDDLPLAAVPLGGGALACAAATAALLAARRRPTPVRGDLR